MEDGNKLQSINSDVLKKAEESKILISETDKESEVSIESRKVLITPHGEMDIIKVAAKSSSNQVNDAESNVKVKPINNSNKKRLRWVTIPVQGGEDNPIIPEEIQGYVLKKRKPPKKEHHSMLKNKLEGMYKLKGTTISYNNVESKIDIDSGDLVLHFNFEIHESFRQWLDALSKHFWFAEKKDSCPHVDPQYEITCKMVKDFLEPPGVAHVQIIQDEQYKTRLRAAMYNLQNRAIELEKLSFKMFPDQFTPKKKAITNSTATVTADVADNRNDFSDGSASDISEEAVKIPETEEDYKVAYIAHCSHIKKGIEKFKRIMDKLHFSKENDDIQSSCSEDDLDDEDSKKPLYFPTPLTDQAIEEQRKKAAKRRDFYGYRVILLNEKPNIPSSDILKVYKKLIRKDLSRIKLPIKLYEPLSVLQRLCEELEFSELLDKAAEESDPFLKLAYVLAFSYTTYAPDQRKYFLRPFTPVRFETYESDRHEKKWRFIGEQVSINPPVSVAFTEHKDWTLYQEFRFDTQFHGVGLETVPVGGYKLVFKKTAERHKFRFAKEITQLEKIRKAGVNEESFESNTLVRIKSEKEIKIFDDYRTNEVYFWSKVGQYVNIQRTPAPAASKCVGLYGVQHIWCKQTDLTGCLIFAKDKAEVKGWVESKHRIEIKGDPSSLGLRRSGGDFTTIWTPNAHRCYYDCYYDFSQFTISLNDEVDMKDVKEGKIPVSDSRLRPDIRNVELGNLFIAEKKHQEVIAAEKKLSETMKDNKEGGFWFKRISDEEETEGFNYYYNNEYWQTKDNCSFKHVGVYNIFNLDA